MDFDFDAYSREPVTRYTAHVSHFVEAFLWWAPGELVERRQVGGRPLPTICLNAPTLVGTGCPPYDPLLQLANNFGAFAIAATE